MQAIQQQSIWDTKPKMSTRRSSDKSFILREREVLLYDSRLYLQVKYNGKIFYSNLYSEVYVYIMESSETTRDIEFVIKSIVVDEQSPEYNLHINNLIDEIAQQCNTPIRFRIGREGSIENLSKTTNRYANPLIVGFLNGMLNNVSGHQQKSFILPDLQLTIDQSCVGEDAKSFVSSRQLEGILAKVDSKVLNDRLEHAGLNISKKSYTFHSNNEIKKINRQYNPLSINYSCEEKIGEDISIYLSVGYKNAQANTSSHNVFSKLFHALRVGGASACW